MKKISSFIAAAALAAGTAWGDGRIYIEDATAKGYMTADGELVVECGLGYMKSSKPRVWDFNISYGIVGKSWSTNVTMHTTPALVAEAWYFMVDGGNSPSFVSPPIPGYHTDSDVWYQVVISNTLYNGSAPAAADALNFVHNVHYVYGAEPGAVVTNALPRKAWGYTVSHLGTLKNERAVVFTNSAATATYTIPTNLKKVQFLVVGGGGGGGAENNPKDQQQGGAGGGGGGVVTGVVARLDKNATLTVSVGAGGANGTRAQKYNSYGYGASGDGLPSYFQVNGVTYVTALGGGGDRGAQQTSIKTGYAGGAGGSSAGSRPGNTTRTAPASSASCVNSAILSNIRCYGVLGNAGGAGATGDFYGFYASGGGGGATEPGGDAASFTGDNWDTCYFGGIGGEGLASDITGTSMVYGSGGGGGTIHRDDGRGGRGGTGAGNGNIVLATDCGSNALPNQGGGGGGGGRDAKYGGKGGSGIVVIRYRITDPATFLMLH